MSDKQDTARSRWIEKVKREVQERRGDLERTATYLAQCKDIFDKAQAKVDRIQNDIDFGNQLINDLEVDHE